MEQRVLLVSEDMIKRETIIETNTSADVLQKVILNVQEIQLKPILGATLYTALIDDVRQKIEDSSHELSEYHSTLLHDYVIPYLIHETVAEFIVVNNYKVSNKGTVRLTDSSLAASNAQDIEYIKNFYDNYAATFKARLIKYLGLDNPPTDRTDRNTTSTSIGWYLDVDDRECRGYNI